MKTSDDELQYLRALGYHHIAREIVALRIESQASARLWVWLGIAMCAASFAVSVALIVKAAA